MDVDRIEEEAKRKRQIRDYEYRFNWPELASINPDLASSITQLLDEVAPLMSIAVRKSDEQTDYTEIKLIRDFLFRGTKALRSTLCLEAIGNYDDAWSTARVVVERAIYLAYLLKTGEAKEFFEYSALEMKKWAYQAVYLKLLPGELVGAFDNEMEEALEHRLGRPKPEWSNPTIERMCKESFGAEQGRRIYSLYRMASAHVHPARLGGDEYLEEAMMEQGIPIPRGIALQAALGALEALIATSRPILMEITAGDAEISCLEAL